MIIGENDCMEAMKSGDVIIFEAGDNFEDRKDIEPALYDRAQEEIDLEALAQELCVAMEEDDTVLLGENELCGTLGYAKKFLDLAEHLMKELDMDIPVPALFVASNDLLEHVVNLKKYAEVFLVQE